VEQRERALQLRRVSLKQLIFDLKEFVACKETDLDDIEEELKRLARHQPPR